MILCGIFFWDKVEYQLLKVNMKSNNLTKKKIAAQEMPPKKRGRPFSKIEACEEEILKELTITDNRENKVKIYMEKRPNRTLRLKIKLNEIDLEPCTFSGTMAGLAYFKMIENTLLKK